MHAPRFAAVSVEGFLFNMHSLCKYTCFSRMVPKYTGEGKKKTTLQNVRYGVGLDFSSALKCFYKYMLILKKDEISKNCFNI